MKNLTKIIQQLRQSQKKVIDELRPFSKNQDWRMVPSEWSFREVAAHMATTEEECFQERLKLIASGKSPQFEYYLNSDRDFSQIELRHSIKKWQENREKVIDDVRALPTEAWQMSGFHQTFGKIKIADCLQIMMDHDGGHLVELQPMVAAFQAEQ